MVHWLNVSDTAMALLEKGSAFHGRVVAKECWRLGTFDQLSEMFKHVR